MQTTMQDYTDQHVVLVAEDEEAHLELLHLVLNHRVLWATELEYRPYYDARIALVHSTQAQCYWMTWIPSYQLLLANMGLPDTAENRLEIRKRVSRVLNTYVPARNVFMTPEDCRD